MSNHKKIGLLGPFGSGNLGDAAIQEAAIFNIKRTFPDAEICAFSHNPEDTERRHGIRCYRLCRKRENVKSAHSGIVNRLFSIHEKLRDVKNDICFLKECYKILKPFDLLIMSGGGQLDDYWGGAWGHPFVLLRWSLLARLARTKLAYLSVGADSVRSRLSRCFIKMALSLADYRSFRENRTREFVEGLGLRKDNHVYPDLAYSLPVERKNAIVTKGPLRVGISPISASAWTSYKDEEYLQYRNALFSLVRWLAENEYRVLFFPSQVVMDTPIIDEIMHELKSACPELSMHVGVHRVASLTELMAQISTVDLVIAARLHAVLLSTLMFKPVMAIAYNNKVNILMNDLTCHDYSIDIAKATFETLKNTFISLRTNMTSVRETIRRQVTLYVQQLDDQYRSVFKLLN
ncbi:polysaccharide pyruvyl transferase family protein [candidate division KSB1 bacterium]|nr:polysaccharide pyruvyl transferase family protein [candidate division KSB1 bacterium]